MNVEERSFERYLRTKGLKLTPQRKLIARKVFRTRDHFEVDDLFLTFRREGQRLSRATIYRTIPLLVESGLIREVPLGKHQVYYEHVPEEEHHDHLVCSQCGRVIEFCDESIEKLQNDVCAKHGFEAHSHNLEIKGICRRCRKRTSRISRTPSA